MKSKIRRVKAGELSLADLATDDTVYIVGLEGFFSDIEHRTDEYGHEYELGRVLRKNVRNSMVAYLQDNGITSHKFYFWHSTQSLDSLYNEMCGIDGVGHTTAILLVVALRNALPPIEDIVASSLHDSLFVSPSDDEMERIRCRFYGPFDTLLDIRRIYDCASAMFKAYVPSLKLKNPPTEYAVIEKVFAETNTWMSNDNKYGMDKTIHEYEETVMRLISEPASILPEINPQGASEDQLSAINGIRTSNRLCCLRGIPGSGKSKIIEWLFGALGDKVLITSYTNKACAVLNQRINGYEIGGCNCIRSVLSTSAMVSSNEKFAAAVSRVQLVIVDESSFLSMKALGHVLRILNHCRKDCRLLLVGDPDQLPPVQEYGRPFLNLCRFADTLGVQVFKIETFHRSNAEYIYQAFIGLREAGMHFVKGQKNQVEIIKAKTMQTAVQHLCAAYMKTLQNQGSVTAIAETNAQCNAINLTMAELLYGNTLTYRRGGFEAKHVVVNKVGMRAVVCDNYRDKNRNVLLTKNEFVDVESASADGSVVVRRRMNGQLVNLDPEKANTYLQIGWACTVHKAQGSEEDVVYYLFDADANRAGFAFSCQKELKYVANSRARNLLRIVAVDSTLVNMIEVAAAVPINTINSVADKMYISSTR